MSPLPTDSGRSRGNGWRVREIGFVFMFLSLAKGRGCCHGGRGLRPASAGVWDSPKYASRTLGWPLMLSGVSSDQRRALSQHAFDPFANENTTCMVVVR